MDPHKRSMTIEVAAGDETILGAGRFATTVDGYRAMRSMSRGGRSGVWAIEGCAGIGGHVATRSGSSRRGARAPTAMGRGATCAC
jgi:transposase